MDVQLGSYISAAQLTAYAYGWLSVVSDEYKMASRIGASWSLAIYFMSRIAELSYLSLVLLIASVPIENCQVLLVMTGTCGMVSGISTAYLFFLRVRAVFLHARYITVVFGVLWLVAGALSILTVSSLRAAHIPKTRYCYDNTVKEYRSLPSIAIFIYDTPVFLAITWRLAANAVTDKTWRARILSIVNGKGLYSLSKALLQYGQIYYFATILFFFGNLVVMLSPSINPAFNSFMVTAYICFTNIMACSVFRGVALGTIEQTPAGLNTTRIAAAFQMDSLPTTLDEP